MGITNHPYNYAIIAQGDANRAGSSLTGHATAEVLSPTAGQTTCRVTPDPRRGCAEPAGQKTPTASLLFH
ncbi:hypothetical protein [Persicitalea jodogahamensis]|uniref:hypothetical protein n=1 Tax=Persicitalea jodogahamensis TaxID=402147 RepID=UPI00167372C1|nr:hypothetical protein [Persicitalea jodogahamensis]